MGTVMLHNAASADGFIADEKKQVGPLSGYYGNGDIELTDSAIADVPDGVRRAYPPHKRGRLVAVKTCTTPATPSTTNALEPRHIMPELRGDASSL